MSVLVCGSVAIDRVKTPDEERGDQLGGSASYASIASSYFTSTRLNGIVGADFPEEFSKQLQGAGVETEGLKVDPEGKTFFWSGEYFDDMNTRETKEVCLNVIENFKPELTEGDASAEVVLLANMSPENQGQVLDQMKDAKCVLADSMDLWIQIARPALDALLKRVDVFVINDGEAKMMAENNHLIEVGSYLRSLGPKYVVIKKGEHGALLFGPGGQFFSCGAFPLPKVVDPTGAGDSFIGALAGFVAKEGAEDVSFEQLKQAVVYGTVVASYNCESFSAEKMLTLKMEDIEERLEMLREYTAF